MARKEAGPGLGISRLDASDFCRFMRLARLFGGAARALHQRQQVRWGGGVYLRVFGGHRQHLNCGINLGFDTGTGHWRTLEPGAIQPTRYMLL